MSSPVFWCGLPPTVPASATHNYGARDGNSDRNSYHQMSFRNLRGVGTGCCPCPEATTLRLSVATILSVGDGHNKSHNRQQQEHHRHGVDQVEHHTISCARTSAAYIACCVIACAGGGLGLIMPSLALGVEPPRAGSLDALVPGASNSCAARLSVLRRSR